MLWPPKPSWFPGLKSFPFSLLWESHEEVKPFVPRCSLFLPCRTFPCPALWQATASSMTIFPSIVPWGQVLAPSTGVTCGHWLLHQWPLFSWFQGTSCVLSLLQSPFCTWSEKSQWDGRRPAVVQLISPKNRHNSEILLKFACIAPKGHVELFKRHLCHCGGGGGWEGQFSPQIPLLRGLFVPWGFSAPEITETEGIKSTSVVSHL